MTFARVKNARGTGGQVPPYPYNNMSWLKYWEKRTGKTAFFCGVYGCANKAEHGGHVKRCDVFLDSSTYIVPLCAECNNPNNTQEFYVNCELCAV